MFISALNLYILTWESMGTDGDCHLWSPQWPIEELQFWHLPFISEPRGPHYNYLDGGVRLKLSVEQHTLWMVTVYYTGDCPTWQRQVYGHETWHKKNPRNSPALQTD